MKKNSSKKNNNDHDLRRKKQYSLEKTRRVEVIESSSWASASKASVFRSCVLRLFLKVTEPHNCTYVERNEERTEGRNKERERERERDR